MQGIFISYRRQDSQSAAGRLADDIKERMAGVSLFRDVETIEPGIDFVDAIGRALHSCAVLIAVIGPRWTTVTDAAGQRRLDDPNDYTRLEIATALARKDVRVIPVLVEGAQMPSSGELPENLQPLSRRNAIELTDKRWDYDVSQLVETLYKALGIQPPAPQPQPGPEPVKPAAKPWRKWAWGTVIVLGLASAIYESQQDTLGPADMADYAEIARQQMGQTTPATAMAPAPVAVPVQHNLSGNWRDSDGGTYQVVQQGEQVAFQGMTIHGPAAGGGVLRGNLLSLEYTVNGYPVRAQMQLSGDGAALSGQYRDMSSAEVGSVHLRRLP